VFVAVDMFQILCVCVTQRKQS